MASVLTPESFNITTAFLLGLVGFVSLVLIFLIIFEGRTNKQIKSLLKRLDHLQGKVSSTDKKLDSLTRVINEKDTDIRKSHHLQIGHHSEAFYKPTSHRTPPKTAKKKGGIFHKLQALWILVRSSKYFSEAYLVSYIISITGTVILGLGLTFYVKFTLSQQVFNVTGKIIVGIFSSALLIAIGHIFHKRNKIFSSVLLGGAIAVLYYTFALTYYQYHLLNEITTLAIIIALTAFSIGISLAYKRQVLAFIALAAAFTSPVMVNFTADNYIILFTYILVIDLGVLVLAIFRKWTILFVITNLFTIAFYAAWLIDALNTDKTIPLPGSLIYLTVFYIIFVLIHITWKVRTNKRFMPIELTFVITNTLVYFTGGYIILNTVSDAYNGLFTAFIALINFIFLLALHKNPRAHFTVKYAFFGLAVIFIVLIPPIELVGRSITLTWAFQIVLLLWVAQQINVSLMRIGAILVSLMLSVSLGMDMWNMYVETSALSDPMPLFRNIGFITNISATIGFTANLFLLTREKYTYFVPYIKVNHLKALFGLLAFVSFYLTFYLEIRYHLLQLFKAENLIRQFIALYNAGFIALLASVTFFKKDKALGMVSAAAGVVAFILYFSVWHFLFIDVRNDYLLANLITLTQYRIHFLVIGLLLFILLSMQRSTKRLFNKKWPRELWRWTAYFLLVFIISSETDHIAVIQKFQDGYIPSTIAEETHKLIYTIIWSVIASITAIGGIFIPSRAFRQIGFTFFILIAGKLVIYDLPALDPRQQVIGFITAGGSIIITTLIYHIRQPISNLPDETVHDRYN